MTKDAASQPGSSPSPSPAPAPAPAPSPAPSAATEFQDALRAASAEKAAGKPGASISDDTSDGKAAPGADDDKTGADTAAHSDKKAGADTAAGKTTDADAPNNAAGKVAWSKVDPAVKAAFDEASTPAAKAAIERMVSSNLQRGKQIATLKTSLSKGRSKPGNAGHHSAIQSSAGKMRAALESKEVKDLEEEAPEAVAALRAVSEPIIKAVEDTAQVMASIATDEALAEVDAQEAIVADAHPDWIDVTASPEFDAWSKTAPRYVQEMIRRQSTPTKEFPKGRITDGEEAAHVLTLFKASLESTEGQGDEPPAPGKGKGKDQPSPVEEKRQRQQASAVTPAINGNGRGAVSGVADDDFKGALRAASKEKAREREKQTARRTA